MIGLCITIPDGLGAFERALLVSIDFGTIDEPILLDEPTVELCPAGGHEAYEFRFSSADRSRHWQTRVCAECGAEPLVAAAASMDLAS